MPKHKILFVTQEIYPYMDESPMANTGRFLPQGIQEKGKEIRTFMPRYGCINERRNQLHEVIRLSGMNLIIDDTDHPLIIKVASIQAARLQVYFIDNEDYFQRKFVFTDKNGQFFPDNDERAIFYAMGVIETVKKLGWAPDIIHCHGWFASLLPLFIKRAYKDNPLFAETKVVCSVYDDEFLHQFDPKAFFKKVRHEGIADKDLKQYKNADFSGFMKAAIEFSDAVVIGSEKIRPDIMDFAKKSKKPLLPYYPKDKLVDACDVFYDELLVNEEVLM
jgi:starch synthase